VTNGFKIFTDLSTAKSEHLVSCSNH